MYINTLVDIIGGYMWYRARGTLGVAVRFLHCG